MPFEKPRLYPSHVIQNALFYSHDTYIVAVCRMSGLETLTKLHSLDMSHNLLRRLDPAVLQRFQHLVTLKLAMNEIEEMSDMPTLSKLTVLHINDNKVDTGVHIGLH